MSPTRSLAVLAAGLLAGSSVVAAPVVARAADAAPTTYSALPAVLPSFIPAWAKAAEVVGSTPSNQAVFLDFALPAKDPAGEKAYGVAASTPGNPLYRHWLTADQFQQRFGAKPGAATALTAALKTLGITSVTTMQGGLGVMAITPASVASSVFHVGFEEREHAGQSLRVPTTEPTIPAVLRPLIAGMSGLTEHPLHTDNTGFTAVPDAAVAAVAPVAPGVTLPVGGAPTSYFNAGPTSTFFSSKLATTLPTAKKLAADAGTVKPYVTSGYTPAQLRGAYGLDDIKQTGKGVNVGVALFYSGPDVADDLATFSTAFKLPAPDYTDLTPYNEVVTAGGGEIPVLDPPAAAGEQTLDVEAIHQMAPDAPIFYSGAVAPYDEAIYAALDTLIFVGGVEVINNSYGGVGDTDAMDAQIFSTLVTDPAKTMGVGLNYSSGDSADHVASDGEREADFPTTSADVTSVGGTLLEVGRNDDYQGEAYWGTYSSPALTTESWGPFASQAGGAGGGGGVSTFYTQQDAPYQAGVVPAAETKDADNGTAVSETSGTGITTPGRVVPDVSMLGDSTTGILVGETQIPDTTDGTTPNVLMTPQYSYYRIGGTSVSSPLLTGIIADVDQSIGKSVGFANPTMYKFLAQHPGAFRDPQLGRTPTGERLGSTAAQIDSGCTSNDDPDDPTVILLGGSQSCTGAGPGIVPILSEVRADYTDTGNNGVAQPATKDPTGMKVLTFKAGNPVIFHLRAQSVLGTLEDLPGYDDSTGLGSPYAPAFVTAFGGNPAVASPPVRTSTGTGTGAASRTTTTDGDLAFTGSNPLVPIVALVTIAAGAGAVAVRRRLR